MRGKRNVKVFISMLLVLVLVFSGMTSLAEVMNSVREVQAADTGLTEITWADFTGVGYGKTYSSTTSGTYDDADTLFGTAFEDDIIFTAGSTITYATSNGWHGLWLTVTTEGKLSVWASGYNINGSFVGVNEENYTFAAEQFGITSKTFVNERIKLRIEMQEAEEGTGIPSITVKVNDAVAVEDILLANRDTDNYAALGTKVTFCVGTTYTGSVTVPEKQLTEITWADFDGATYGTTYSTTTKVTYNNGDNLNGTAFEDDVIFSTGSALAYGTSGGTHGLWIGVTEEGKLLLCASGYTIDNLIVTPTSNSENYTFSASDYGITSGTFINERITLRIEMRNVTNTTAEVKVFINGQQAGSDISLSSRGDNYGNLGNVVELRCNGFAFSGSVTIPELPLTEITWADFEGAIYGTTYSTTTNVTYREADNLNRTAFEDDVIFSAGSALAYGTSGGTHGLWIGVTEEGKLSLCASGYKDGNNYVTQESGDYTFSASDYGITSGTFIDERVTLRIEMRDVTASSANVKIYINGTQLGDALSLTKNNGNDLGNVVVLKAVSSNWGFTNSVTIPELPLTEITWADFDGVDYGKTYTTKTTGTYEKTSLTETAFEDEISFSAGSALTYGTSNGSHGLWISVSDEGKLSLWASRYTFGGSPVGANTAGYTFEATDFGIDGGSFIGERITLRIEMRDVTETTATIKVFINGEQAGEEISLKQNSSYTDATILGNLVTLVPSSNYMGAVTTLKSEALPVGLDELSWEEFGFTGGKTYTTNTGRAALDREDLNNTLFSGDIEMTAGSSFLYCGLADVGYGLNILANSDGTLSVSYTGATTTLVNTSFNPKHYGLTSFVGQKFNLKIVVKDLDMDAGTATIGVWVNEEILEDWFTCTYDGNPERATTCYGTTLRMSFGNTSMTPYSSRTEAPMALTKIEFQDWNSEVADDGVMKNLEIEAGAHSELDSLFDTSLQETVQFVGTESENNNQILIFGGVSDSSLDGGVNKWLGIKIWLSGKQMLLQTNVTGATNEQFTLDPEVAGVGTSFANMEFSWKIDTVALGKNVLIYMSFNGNLYNDAPFVLYNYADTMTCTSLVYNSCSVTDTVSDYYVKLGPSIKELPDLYHDLSREDYQVPSGMIAMNEGSLVDGKLSGSATSAIAGRTWSTVGEYCIQYSDGVSEYVQNVIIYSPNDMKVTELVRALKYAKSQQDASYTKVQIRMCDVDCNDVIDTSDVLAIRQILVGTYNSDSALVMPISGFWGPAGSMITDETYQLIKKAGINQITQVSNEYSNEVMDRYRVYQQLSLAQKYGMGVIVSDGNLLADPTTATTSSVATAVKNYKDYQSFGGLFVVDEPYGKTYPINSTNTKTIEKYKTLAQAIRDNDITIYGNLHPHVTDMNEREDGFYTYKCYLDEYVEKFNPTFLSFDHYLFHKALSDQGTMGGSVENANRWFENLAMARYVANNNDTGKEIPFRAYVQVGDGFEFTDLEAGNPSEGEFKWQANTALAFGAKGIQYFPLVQPKGFSNVDDTTSSSGLINKNGTTTEWYAYAQKVNAQVAAIDEVLMKSTSDGLMSTGGYAASQATDKVESMALKERGPYGLWYSDKGTLTTTVYSNDEGYNGAKVSCTDSDYGALTGCFTYGDKHALYIVNYNVEQTNKVTVTFDDNKKATLIHNAVTTEATGTSVDITLGAGEAVLVVF